MSGRARRRSHTREVAEIQKDAASRTEIDAAFAAMADDPEYQEEALRICEEFAVADWEALLLGEQWLDLRASEGGERPRDPG